MPIQRAKKSGFVLRVKVEDEADNQPDLAAGEEVWGWLGSLAHGPEFQKLILKTRGNPNLEENLRDSLLVEARSQPKGLKWFPEYRSVVIDPQKVPAMARDLAAYVRSLKPAKPSGKKAANRTKLGATQNATAKQGSSQMALPYEKSFRQDGLCYFPLSAVAPLVQAPRTTLLDWIKKRKQFDGRYLNTFHLAAANRYFLAEESVIRVANRFRKWPSYETARHVTLGPTKDQSGYVGLTHAAREIGIDHHTLWLWATQGKAPTDHPLDVIRCPQSEQFYIREREISNLKAFVPKTGLRRGRRPQPEHECNKT